MHLLTWHGTFVCLPDQSGVFRHMALAANGDALPLDVDLPGGSTHASIRHPDLGAIQIEAAAEPGAIHLLRDGRYMCADGNTGLVVFDRHSAAGWESFLPLNATDAADLASIMRYRWIVQANRHVIRRSEILVRDGFTLRLGPYALDLSADLGTLVGRRREATPIVLKLTHAGEEVTLLVAEPRSSALVQTELWPPRARRLAEILTFAAHRQLIRREPTQEDFERDVSFLQEKQGAAGLEDLLETMLHDAAALAGPEATQGDEPRLAAGLATVQALLDAAQTRQALAALDRLVALFPGEARLWFRLGEIHQEAGDYGKAQQAWENCVASDQPHDAAALKLANLLAAFGKPLQSIARLDALVAADPTAHDPRAFLAKRYAELGWMDRAVDAFAPIADELGDWKESVRRGLTSQLEELRTHLAALSSQPKPLSPADAVQQARLAFSVGELDICARLLAALSDAAAERVEAHILQADLRLRRDGLTDAIAYLESLDGPERQNAALITALARLHIAASWHEEASAALHALVRHSPRGDALALLSMIAYATADRELLQFATKTWCTAHGRDTMARRWSIAEARLDGRLVRIDDMPALPGDLPFPELMQFWDQAEPPFEVAQAMRSWPDRNPGIVHRVFDDAGARAFLTEFCATEVLECYEAAHHPAMQSDIFRLAFLHVRGGIYVDCDETCVRDMRGVFAALSQVELIAMHAGDAPAYINNAFIAARRGCRIIDAALQEVVYHVLRLTREGKRPDIWEITGPGLLTRSIARFMADPANTGRVMTLSESEYHSFAITQHMAYKTTEAGNWRLQKAGPMTPAPISPGTPRLRHAAPPPQPEINDVMTGWALREVAQWQFRPVRRADAHRMFDELNDGHSWISVYQFADGQVTVKPKPRDLPAADLVRERTERYRRFFQSLVPLLPPGFKTTLCMGMGDALPSSFDVPMFCFQKSIGLNALLLPDIDFLNNDFYTDPQLQDRLSYHEKQRGAVFAGSTTGGLITPAVARDLSTPRLRAAKFFAGSTKVDFRLPSIGQCTTPEVEATLRAMPFCQKPGLDWHEQLRRRMVISMDGNGATCSRVAITLHSNSVLLKYASEHVLHYFAGMQPWVHYVPITQDSDVEQIVDMEARDPDMFAQIAANGRMFAQTYLSADASRRYTAMLLRHYENAFSDTAAPLRPVVKIRQIPPLTPGDRCVMMVHIQSRGDRTAPFGEWHGEPGSTLAIEGFAISHPTSYPAGFTYRAIMANGVLSEVAGNGEYRGTRGENLPTYGLQILLEGDFARKYHVAYEATFVDGTTAGPVPAGTLCAAQSGKQMEAVRITLSERTK